MPGGPKKRFTELLPQVMITKEQKEGVYQMAHDKHLTISDVVRAALDHYIKVQSQDSDT